MFRRYRALRLNRIAFGRVTWSGLLIAAAGWGILAAYPLILPAGGSGSSQAGSQGLSPFILGLSSSAIQSGFAIAILGALENAIGALDRLVGTIVQLRLNTVTKPGQQPQPAAPPPVEVVARGDLNGRAYLLYSDGSVVVETLLGRRRFRSLAEAREFIGPE